MLQGEGLVETRANGRMVTVRFGPEDLDDLLSVRHELESSAVRRGSAIRGDVEPVRAALEAFRQEGASTERLVELDIAFHRALVEFGASRFLLSAWLALAPVLQAVITIGNRRLARRNRPPTTGGSWPRTSRSWIRWHASTPSRSCACSRSSSS